MKVVLKDEFVYVYAPRGRMDDEPRYLLLADDNASDELWAYVGKCDLHGEINIEGNFDPRVKMIAGLKEKRRRIEAEAHKECMQIDREISELLAIEGPKHVDDDEVTF